MKTPIIWVIDESEEELTTSKNVLKSIFPEEVKIEAITVLPKKEDYVRIILENPDSACIIIDQRLKTTGVANYFGIELAQFLRSINQKIPIYILTNYTDNQDEYSIGKWSVEDIIPKSDLNVSGQLTVTVARILRRIDIYKDIMMDREERFNALLRKSLAENLSTEELRELDELQFARTSTILASEVGELKNLEDAVERFNKMLEKIKTSSSSKEKH